MLRIEFCLSSPVKLRLLLDIANQVGLVVRLARTVPANVRRERGAEASLQDEDCAAAFYEHAVMLQMRRLKRVLEII